MKRKKHIKSAADLLKRPSVPVLLAAEALAVQGRAVITERKLETALAKIARRQAGHPHGQPMSGLSISAEYYFEKMADHKALKSSHAMRAHATGKC